VGYGEIYSLHVGGSQVCPGGKFVEVYPGGKLYGWGVACGCGRCVVDPFVQTGLLQVVCL
jgi:hypothetical protein